MTHQKMEEKHRWEDKHPGIRISNLVLCLLYVLHSAVAHPEPTTYLWGLWRHPPTLAPFSALSPSAPTVFVPNDSSISLPYKRTSPSLFPFNASFPLKEDTLVFSYANFTCNESYALYNDSRPFINFLNWTRRECLDSVSQQGNVTRCLKMEVRWPSIDLKDCNRSPHPLEHPWMDPCVPSHHPALLRGDIMQNLFWRHCLPTATP